MRLELNPLLRCRIVVTDEDEHPLERAWMMPFIDDAGVGENWSYSDEEGVCSLLLPGEPFLLRIGCPGFEAQWVGPLDPLTIPGELPVTLVGEPQLHGVVLSEGVPVSGATVHLVQSLNARSRVVYKGFTSRFFSNVKPVEADAQGRFRVPLGEPEDESWSLLVEKHGFARSEYLVGQVAAARDVPEIEVNLTSGGTLEGRVFVPSTQSQEGVVVACSREDGRPLVTRTDADGRYRFEHLTPGRWLVEDREEAPVGSSMSTVSAEEMPFLPNVEILEGGTTTFDLDTHWRVDLAVQGSLVLGGEGAQGWTAVLIPGHGVENPRTFEPVTLDAEGRFRAPATPGHASLILRSPTNDPVKRVIDWELLVDADTAPVDIHLSVGAVRGSGHDPGTGLRIAHQLVGGAVTYINFSADELGAFEVHGVPAGEIGLQRGGQRGWETLERLQLAPGETLTID